VQQGIDPYHLLDREKENDDNTDPVTNRQSVTRAQDGAEPTISAQ
jgi:hypothetical protein